MAGSLDRGGSVAWALTLVLAWAPGPGLGQDPEDEHLLLLDAWQAQVELTEARERWQRTRELFAGGVVPRDVLATDQAAYETALIRYRRSATVLANALPNVVVETAVKRQDKGGRKFVDLTLVNYSPSPQGDSSLRALLAREDGLVDLFSLRELRRLFVSLKDLGTSELGDGQSAFLTPIREVIISKPYERLVERLAPGHRVTLTFQLLRDVESVVVSLRHAGRIATHPVKLEYDSASPVTASSSQISQEADLGQTAVYDLLIERTAGGARSFHLSIRDLPSEIRYEFLDPSTAARLSDVNFLAGVASKRLDLRLSLPDTPSENVPLDAPLRFAAVVAPAEAVEALDRMQGFESVRALGAAVVELRLVPRGLGDIVVAAKSLYHETGPGQPVTTEILVRNSGSRRLDSIRFAADLPGGWQADVAPRILSALEVDEEARVRLEVRPDPVLERGEYSVRLQTRCSSGGQPLDVQDKILRIKLLPEPNTLATLLIAGLVLLLLGGALAGGILITRR